MNDKTDASLQWRSGKGTLVLLLVQSVVLFASAGTLRYWQAWIYLTLHAVSATATNAYLLRHDRELLERRLALDERGEQERVHKLFFTLLRVVVLGLFVLSGLDRRFAWSAVALPIVIAGLAMVGLAMALVFLVLRENSFASSVIEVAPEQTVVSSGPYRYVRHPMYTGFLLVGLATPLSLGSYVAELLFVPTCALFVMRLRAEERFLAASLPGYALYLRTTRHRLVPGIW